MPSCLCSCFSRSACSQPQPWVSSRQMLTLRAYMRCSQRLETTNQATQALLARVAWVLHLPWASAAGAFSATASALSAVHAARRSLSRPLQESATSKIASGTLRLILSTPIKVSMREMITTEGLIDYQISHQANNLIDYIMSQIELHKLSLNY